MSKRVYLCDIDNTLIDGWFAFAAFEYEVEKGILKPDTLQNIQNVLHFYRSGQLSYAEMLHKTLRIYACALKGKNLQEVFNADYEFACCEPQNIRPFFRDLLTHLSPENTDFFLVSTEPSQMAKALALTIDADEIGSEMAVDDDSNFTGDINILVTPEAKLAAIEAKGISLSSIYAAFGDSKSDEGMLAAAKHAFAVCPSPELRAIAEERGWNIIDEHTSFERYHHLFV
ncbi:MAG: HAD family hydrolase [Candidatus Saccharimonadales bacterium]